jgi:hypothetical protein
MSPPFLRHPQVVRYEILRFLKYVKEFADTMVAVEEHQDNFTPDRVAEQVHEPVQLINPGPGKPGVL